jgi:hypothetical protein
MAIVLGEFEGLRRTRLNISSMSNWGTVDPSFLMKRKPCVQAASRTCCATVGEGSEISITGISDSAMLGFS